MNYILTRKDYLTKQKKQVEEIIRLLEHKQDITEKLLELRKKELTEIDEELNNILGG
jgi:hypothetical protein